MACHFPYYVSLTHPQWDAFTNTFIEEVPVPCGKCYNCIQRRKQEWGFRLLQEIKRSRFCYFVTLTYNTEHVPFTKKGYKTLDKEDLKNFFKRLRYHHKDHLHTYMYDQQRQRLNLPIKKLPIKYYAVGEYGSIRKRPHYHIILYNTYIPTIIKSWKDENENPIGSIKILPAHHNTIFYTLKYIEKTGPIMPTNFDGQKEFSTNSNFIGANYLTPNIIKWHRSDPNNNFCHTEGGYKIPIPRYYRDKIYGEPDLKALLPHIKKACETNNNNFVYDCQKKGIDPQFRKNMMNMSQAHKLQYHLKHRDVY